MEILKAYIFSENNFLEKKSYTLYYYFKIRFLIFPMELSIILIIRTHKPKLLYKQEFSKWHDFIKFL